MIIEAYLNLQKNTTDLYGYPDQFTTMHEKSTGDWIKKNLDYFAGVAYSKYRQNEAFRKNYKLLNGEFDFTDYMVIPETKMILDYLKDVPGQEQDIPKHLKHYPILNPPINTLLGEMTKRPHKYSVKATDEISIDENIDFRSNLLKEFALNSIKAQLEGTDLSPEEIEQAAAQEIQKKILNYTTVAEQWGNKVLSALKHHFDFRHKSFMAFRDLLVTGREYHHFYPDNSRLGFTYRVENPANVWTLNYRNAITTKDCWAGGTLEVLTFAEIINRYKLTDEEMEHLKTYSLQGLRNNEYSAFSPAMPNPNYDPIWQLTFESADLSIDGITPNAYAFSNQFSYTVVTAYWESQRPVYKRTYIDESGYEQTDFVNEDYKICKDCGDVSLEKTWENIWMRGLKIGANIYFCDPLEYVNCMPIVGIVNTFRNTQGKSLLSMMKPYQVLYNICLNQLWEALEKDLGVQAIIDMKVIPNNSDADAIDQFKTVAKETGFLVIDTSVENTGGPVQFNQMTRTDLSQQTYINSRIQLAEWARNQAWELVGVTRQRTGSVLATETATGTQTAMSQSFAQTEPWFHFHDVILRDVYQMLLDVTQYIELQKPDSTLNYLNNDLESVFLKVTRDEILRDLHVYVTSYAEDRDNIEKLRSLMQPAIQNGADLADVADMLTADSERSLREILQKVQQRNQEAKQQQMQLEQQKLQQSDEQFQMKLQAQQEKEARDMENENMNKELDRQNRLQIEELRGIAAEGSYSQTTDTTELLTEQTKSAMERSKQLYERSIKQKELQQQDRKLDIEEMKAKDALEIARLRDKGQLGDKSKKKK
jgi:hypothetical protein